MLLFLPNAAAAWHWDWCFLSELPLDFLFHLLSYPLGNIALSPSCCHYPHIPWAKRPVCILFQLWKDCNYRGADLNPFKFGEDIFMESSHLGWLIFDYLRPGLKNKAVGEEMKTTQLCHLILFSLSPPLCYIGISLSSEVCNLMAIRYGDPDLQISFESFVCFMLRVEIMGGEAGAPCLAWQAGLPAEPWPLWCCSHWQWPGQNEQGWISE